MSDIEDQEDSASLTQESSKQSQKERRKIEIKFIENKTRRHVTFSKRKHGIMKKAFELSVLTGTQVLLLVVSETGLVYTFSTPKFEPIVTQQEGRNLIQACLNAPDEEEEDDEEGDPNRMNQRPLPLQQPMQQQQQQQQQLHLHPGLGMMEGDRDGMLPPMGIPPSSNHGKNGSIDSADASNISMSANGSYSYSMSGMEGINDMDNGRNIMPTQNMLRQQQQQQPRQQHSSGIRMQPEIKTELKSPMSLNRSVLGANDYVAMQQAQQGTRTMLMPQQSAGQQQQQQQQQQPLQPPPPPQTQQQQQQFQQLGMVQGHPKVPIPPQMGKQGYIPNQPQQQPQQPQQQQRLQPQPQPQQQYLGVDHAGNYQNYFQDYQQNQF